MSTVELRKALLGAAFAIIAGGAPALAQQGQAAAPAGSEQKSASAAGQGDDPVVAKVNGSEIKRSEVMQFLTQLPPQIQQMPPQMLVPLVVDQLVTGKLVAIEARKAKLEDDPEVKKRLKDLEDRVLQEVFLTRKVKERLGQGALEKQYKEYLEQNPAQEEVRARHILVDTEQKAKNVITKLNGGADFAAMAKENSSDGSAATGGDLGFFSKGDMVPEFSEAAFGMKPGAYTKTPVQSQFGWHVIQVEERRTKPQPTFEQVKDQLSNDASQEIAQAVVEELRKGATIERFSMDGTPVPK